MRTSTDFGNSKLFMKGYSTSQKGRGKNSTKHDSKPFSTKNLKGSVSKNELGHYEKVSYDYSTGVKTVEYLDNPLNEDDSQIFKSENFKSQPKIALDSFTGMQDIRFNMQDQTFSQEYQESLDY